MLPFCVPVRILPDLLPPSPVVVPVLQPPARFYGVLSPVLGFPDVLPPNEAALLCVSNAPRFLLSAAPPLSLEFVDVLLRALARETEVLFYYEASKPPLSFR